MIEHKARGLFTHRREQLNAAMPQPPEQELWDFFYGRVLAQRGMTEATLAAVHPDFLIRSNRIFVRSVKTLSGNVEHHVNLQLSHPKGLSVPMPGDVGTAWKTWVMPEEEIPAFFVEKAKWQAESNALDVEQRIYVQKVRTLLAAYKTLKQALAAWPALWELVPATTQTEYNAATPAPPPPPAVDVGDLNAGLVIAKMTK